METVVFVEEVTTDLDQTVVEFSAAGDYHFQLTGMIYIDSDYLASHPHLLPLFRHHKRIKVNLEAE